MWIRRWGAVFVLIVSLCGALCSCGTRNDEKNVEEQTEKALSRITVVFEKELYHNKTKNLHDIIHLRYYKFVG